MIPGPCCFCLDSGCHRRKGATDARSSGTPVSLGSLHMPSLYTCYASPRFSTKSASRSSAQKGPGGEAADRQAHLQARMLVSSSSAPAHAICWRVSGAGWWWQLPRQCRADCHPTSIWCNSSRLWQEGARQLPGSTRHSRLQDLGASSRSAHLEPAPLNLTQLSNLHTKTLRCRGRPSLSNIAS